MTDSIISPQLAKNIKFKGIKLTEYATKYLRDNFYTQYYYNNNDVLQHSESYIEDWVPALRVSELRTFFELNNNLFIDVILENYTTYKCSIINTRNDKVIYNEVVDSGDEEEMYLNMLEYIVDSI